MLHPLLSVQDSARGHRNLWTGVCAVLAGVFGLLGAFYLSGGIVVAASSKPYRVLLAIPGGMRVHGLVMLSLGVCLACGLVAPLYGRPVVRWWLRRTLLAAFAYSLWLVCEFTSSGLLTGAWAVAGVVWWSASAILSVLLVKLPPPRGDDSAG